MRITIHPSATQLFTSVAKLLRDLRGAQITSDHIRAICERGGVTPADPRTWGVVFRMLRDHGILVETGRGTTSNRPEANNRFIRIWEVA